MQHAAHQHSRASKVRQAWADSAGWKKAAAILLWIALLPVNAARTCSIVHSVIFTDVRVRLRPRAQADSVREAVWEPEDVYELPTPTPKRLVLGRVFHAVLAICFP